MGAEHAPEHMQLVDDDVAQAHPEVAPSAVVGEEAAVHHLRVGEDHVRVAADPRALIGWGVAVVGGGHQARHREVGEAAELVLGQRLGGEQGQGRAGTDAVGHRLGDGQLVAERFARGGAGGNHRGPSGPDEVDGCGLMRPEPRDPELAETLLQVGWQGTRRVGRSGETSGDPLDVHETLTQARRETMQGGIDRIGRGDSHGGPALGEQAFARLRRWHLRCERTAGSLPRVPGRDIRWARRPAVACGRGRAGRS